ncbi:MAG: hypothetical protein A2445_04795 [Candidatus Jacksonbacteria bacterium RIFOXYC2_FULL_44_29]|nr:MAG: hypothetical protein A2240_01080 [Candidatus Jacksonbacteria bacterium RIFOXYA2_FULL_43_12]OGY75641.1 MAG: hypothetical protein A2295_04675 [Candidatus Jacksonbacteria bacterium RIFOXYB2_FULL_44_15]OGY77785.1 MAG: hypothetical protein A2445_04795 [Candidatus Jacksonbacteria bacterium RIFOXYC2_FULL_44_29]OGY79514.1 MAG: hypothetical protein A2550_02085 [Candidatus Jacksonbacteria bacterium RIFOXYD2_FULL_43_21]HBH46385.1 hypothetical protein [Candidatus Jacksonbacteria bacterium]
MFPLFSLQFWQTLHFNNLFILAGELLLAGGWFFIFWQLWPAIKEDWINWRQSIFARGNPFVVMELAVPSRNVRHIEAIEQTFAQIHGLRRQATWWEIWWKGQYVLKVTLEIVSFEGRIKFYITSTFKHKHLIEHALYAQYPDLEIKYLRPEEDFIHIFPDKMPHPEFDMLGTEYVASRPPYFPLKTYREYIDKKTGEYLDPLRHLWELFNNLREGEYMWYQLVLVPEFERWSLEQRKHVDILTGKKKGAHHHGKSILGIFGDQLSSIFWYILLLPWNILKEVFRQLTGGTVKIASDQVTKNTLGEVGRQFKGTARETGRQIYCLHEAFLSQFRKRKPKSPASNAVAPPSWGPINIENKISFDPAINVNAPGVSFPSDYLFMTERQKQVIDAVERKLSQPAFKVCMRVLYFAKKPVFSKFRFWSESHGAFKHFNDLEMNYLNRGFWSRTTADYFFAKKRKIFRQNAIIANTKSRDWYAGDDWNYFSVEEVASLWHFPHQHDLLANIQTAQTPVAPPPNSRGVRAGFRRERLLEVEVGSVPSNLPVEEYEYYNYK